jgi:uncharacterized protein (DUF58 family)
MAKLTLDLIMAALEDGDYVGFCIACGEQHDECEPDARRYPCTACGKNTVYGAEEILLMITA